MNKEILTSYGALVMRMTLGIDLLVHSAYWKLFVAGMPKVEQYFAGIGLPAMVAWPVLMTEILTGLMLVFGVWARLAAFLAIPIMIGATLAHVNGGWFFENSGGGWEYPAFWTLALGAQVLLGGGALALAEEPIA